MTAMGWDWLLLWILRIAGIGVLLLIVAAFASMTGDD